MIVRDAVISKDRYRLGGSAAAAEAPARPALSLAEVSAWLTNESDSVRRACAALLASELNDVRAAARREGYAEGQVAAKREIEAQHAAVVSQFGGLARDLQAAHEKAADTLSNSCAAIVAEAFTKIAGKRLVSEAAALGAVRAVVGRLRDSRRYTLHVHPTALATIQAARDELQSAHSGISLDVVADPALQFGGCRVQSELGTLDAGFDVQLRSLFAILQAAHRQQTGLE